MNKENYKSFLCICSSFLLAVFATVLGLLLSVKLGFSTNNSVIRALDEVNYSKMVHDELLQKCEAFAIPNALSGEVFEGVFSEEMVRHDCSAYLEAALESRTYNINLDDASEKLTQNINDYVKKHDLKADGNKDEIISDFVYTIMEYYENIIKVPYAGEVGNIFRIISKYFIYVFPVMWLLLAVVIVILYRMNTHKVNRVFRYMSYGFMSGAFSILIIPIGCYVTSFYKKIQIYPEYVYRFLVQYIENGLLIMLIIGCIFLLVSGIMIGLSCYIKHKMKTKMG